MNNHSHIHWGESLSAAILFAAIGLLTLGFWEGIPIGAIAGAIIGLLLSILVEIKKLRFELLMSRTAPREQEGGLWKR